MPCLPAPQPRHQHLVRALPDAAGLESRDQGDARPRRPPTSPARVHASAADHAGRPVASSPAARVDGASPQNAAGAAYRAGGRGDPGRSPGRAGGVCVVARRSGRGGPADGGKSPPIDQRHDGRRYSPGRGHPGRRSEDPLAVPRRFVRGRHSLSDGRERNDGEGCRSRGIFDGELGGAAMRRLRLPARRAVALSRRGLWPAG